MRNRWILPAIFLFALFSGSALAEGMQEVRQERRADQADESVEPAADVPSENPLALTVSALKGPSAIGMVKLLAENPSYGSGVETEYQIAGSPDVLVSRLLSEEVDIAALPTNLAVKLYNKGVPYRFGAVTGYGLLYLLSRDPEIRGLEDLKGGDVYNIGRGATPDFMFRFLLNSLGIDPDDDVTIRFTYSHPELAKMLIAGKVETGVLPEPFVTQVLMKSGEVRIAADFQQLWRQVQGDEETGGADTAPSYPMTCIVLREALLEERPQVIASFLDSYRNSIRWVKENPEKAGELSEKHGIGMPAAVAAASVPRLNLAFVPGPESKAMMTRYLQVLLDFDPDSVGGRLPDDRFYAGE